MSTFRDQIVALVHADARACPIEQARHGCFIGGRLAISFAFLAMLPPFLIYHGLSTAAEARAIAWLLIPPFAMFLVVRTGRLQLAQSLCLVALGATVATMVEIDPSHVASLAWLVVLTFEALSNDRPSVSGIVAAAAVPIAGILVFTSHTQVGSRPALNLGCAVLPALFFATVQGLEFLVVSRARRRARRNCTLELAALTNVAGDAVLRLDHTGAVLTASEGAPALGIGADDLRGRGLLERMNVADRPMYLKAVADGALTSDPQQVMLRVRTTIRGAGSREDRYCRVELRMVALRADHPEAGCLCAVARLAEESEQQADESSSPNETAENADVWKHRFLAIVSHELRTPLNAIIGFSEMLSSPALVPRDFTKQREYARIINTAGQHLLDTVNSILDVSKIEAGSFDIVPEPFAVGPLIEASCDMVCLKALNGRLDLQRECDPTLPDLVADKRACRQILINLLSNAIKFTPPGGHVSVGARREGAQCVLFVRDTGIGITAGDLPNLGAPFFQGQGDYDRRYEGTGLGLSVVRGLVGLHGGTISITSAPGAGTLVEIHLPFERPSAHVEMPNARIEIKHRLPTAHPALAETTKVKKIA